MVKEFRGDDAGYLDWLATHPDGYVLNVRRNASPDYVVLHRASCGSISNRALAPGAYTERGYRKICADTAEGLRTAAAREGRPDGSFSRRCGLCSP